MTIAIPDSTEPMPATEDEIIAYGRKCLHYGKIATVEFGKACQALKDGFGSWSNVSIAEAMGCDEKTVRNALAAAGFKIIKSEPVRSGDLGSPEPEQSARACPTEGWLQRKRLVPGTLRGFAGGLNADQLEEYSEMLFRAAEEYARKAKRERKTR